MIATVTLNAAIDKTYYVSGFAAGSVHRVVRQIAEPGGKGNNVAKVITLLGGDVVATGCIAGSTGTFIEESLALRGIRTAFVRIPGESRICLNIVDELHVSSTELLEQGPSAGSSDLQALKETVRTLGSQASIVVLSGSLIPGGPADLYVELIGIARSGGARVYLDTSGEALINGIRSKPDLIKPNGQELAQLAGIRPTDYGQYAETAARLQAGGISQICVTMGELGALACIDGVVYRVRPPVVNAVNPVGCGDAFVAGFAYADELGLPAEERLRMATAAAAANAMSEKAGDLERELYERYLEEVRIDRV